jgi:hypothetical protein
MGLEVWEQLSQKQHTRFKIGVDHEFEVEICRFGDRRIPKPTRTVDSGPNRAPVLERPIQGATAVDGVCKVRNHPIHSGHGLPSPATSPTCDRIGMGGDGGLLVRRIQMMACLVWLKPIAAFAFKTDDSIG